MESPRGIEFNNECLKVLIQTLLTTTPQEGCALLIGSYKQSIGLQQENALQIQMIWPCCNIWEPNRFKLLESRTQINSTVQEKLSKESRFVIDPREQLLAKHWARKHNLKVIGSAHSHPHGNPVPSSVDCQWTLAPGVMVIIGKFGEARAWWMERSQNFRPKEVAILSPK